MAARPKNSRAIPKKPLKLKQWNQKMARYPVETIISRNTSHSESIPLIPSGHASSHPSWLSLPGSLPIKAMKTQRGHAGTQHLVRPRRSPHPHLRKPEVSARDLYIQYVIYIYLYTFGARYMKLDIVYYYTHCFVYIYNYIYIYRRYLNHCKLRYMVFHNMYISVYIYILGPSTDSPGCPGAAPKTTPPRSANALICALAMFIPKKKHCEPRFWPIPMDETIRLDDLHGKIGSESVVQECILLYIYSFYI